jgi:hypothetical protein
VLRVGRLAGHIPVVAEVNCNSVIISADAAKVVDVKIGLAPPSPSPLPGVRRMRPVAE